MGYGGRAMELLLKYFKGDLLDLDAGSSDEEDEEEEAVEEGGAAADEGDEMKESDDESGEEGGDEAKELKEARKALRRERAPAPRSKLPPLLVPVAAKRPPQLDWCGVSFGVTPDLLNFWLRSIARTKAKPSLFSPSSSPPPCIFLDPRDLSFDHHPFCVPFPETLYERPSHFIHL